MLVFNLGFDRKGPSDVHWIYYPDRELAFYRVGFYDNIFDTDRMSLYVEIGFARDAVVDVEAMRARVLADLARAGVITDHQLVAEHSVVMDPAYVHITRGSMAEHARMRAELAEPRRALDRPLRRLDLLLHRGQHRRGAGAGRIGANLASGVRGA